MLRCRCCRRAWRRPRRRPRPRRCRGRRRARAAHGRAGPSRSTTSLARRGAGRPPRSPAAASRAAARATRRASTLSRPWSGRCMRGDAQLDQRHAGPSRGAAACRRPRWHDGLRTRRRSEPRRAGHHARQVVAAGRALIALPGQGARSRRARRRSSPRGWVAGFAEGQRPEGGRRNRLPAMGVGSTDRRAAEAQLAQQPARDAQPGKRSAGSSSSGGELGLRWMSTVREVGRARRQPVVVGEPEARPPAQLPGAGSRPAGQHARHAWLAAQQPRRPARPDRPYTCAAVVADREARLPASSVSPHRVLPQCRQEACLRNTRLG
jgi:hypothetical protein